MKFQVAPVGAGGSMVFWAANPAAAGKTGVENMAPSAIVDDSMLMGFTVGDESTVRDAEDHRRQAAGRVAERPDPELALHRLPHGHARRRLRRVRRRLAVGRGVRGRQAREGRRRVHGQPAAELRGRNVHGLEQLHDAQDVRPVPVERPDDVLARALERRGRQDRDHRDAGSGHHDALGTGVAELAAGSARLGRSRIRRRRRRRTARPTPHSASAFGFLQHTGDPHPAAAFPTWSHDGKSIVYVSVACPNPGQQNGCGTQDGRLYKGAADLYEVPYGNKAGGTATPVAGASTTDNEEYYPAFSPDDKLIAFTRVPAGPGDVREPERRDVGRAAPGGRAGEAAGGERSARRAAASRAPASTTTGRSGRPTG